MTRCLLSVCLLAGLAGCNPYVYINVPAQHGDLARNGPNAQIVREVEAEGLRHLLAARPLDQPVYLALPHGTTPLTTAEVARRAGEGGGEGAGPATQVVPVDPAAPIEQAGSRVEVTQVRIRGVLAELDVLYPTLGGSAQLLTVYFEYKPMSDWVVTRVTDWPGARHSIDHGGVVEP